MQQINTPLAVVLLVTSLLLPEKFDFQVKVVIETQTVSRLSPRVSNFFKFHHCSNEDVTCQMILSSQVKRLTSETCKVLGHMSEEVMEAAQKYVAHMIKCRQQMGVADDNVDIHQQVRPPKYFLLRSHPGLQRIKD